MYLCLLRNSVCHSMLELFAYKKDCVALRKGRIRTNRAVKLQLLPLLCVIVLKQLKHVLHGCGEPAGYPWA